MLECEDVILKGIKMSKLYKSYLNLKNEDKEKIYLFKSGMFYIALDKDCEKLSEIFGFKQTKLNEQVNKCGFPISRLEFYIEQLNNRNLQFEIVDGDYSKIENYSDYMNNCKIKKIIQDIKEMDLNNITFKQAYEFLESAKVEIGKIYE